MRETPNLLLKLPDPTDYVLVEDLNENFTILDAEIAKITDEETGVEAKLTKHLEESSGKHIHSSGTNGAGHWIRFDDGTLVCYIGLADIPEDFTWVFPSEFINNEYSIDGVCSTLDEDVGEGGGVITLYNHSYSKNTTSVRLAPIKVHGYGNHFTNVSIKAVGRWK